MLNVTNSFLLSTSFSLV